LPASMSELGSLLVRSHHEVAALPSQQHQHTVGCSLIATKTPLLGAPAPLNDGTRASGASYAERRGNTASCSCPGAAAPNHSLTRDTQAAHHSASAVFEIRENASGSPFWLSHPSRLTHGSTARTPSSTTATGTKNARRCARSAIDATVPRSSRRIDGPSRHQPKRRLPAPRPFALLATGAHSLASCCDTVARHALRAPSAGIDSPSRRRVCWSSSAAATSMS
jgi:hypothetical protein